MGYVFLIQFIIWFLISFVVVVIIVVVVVVVEPELVVTCSRLELNCSVSIKYPFIFLTTPKPTNWNLSLTILAKRPGDLHSLK